MSHPSLLAQVRNKMGGGQPLGLTAAKESDFEQLNLLGGESRAIII